MINEMSVKYMLDREKEQNGQQGGWGALAVIFSREAGGHLAKKEQRGRDLKAIGREPCIYQQKNIPE